MKVRTLPYAVFFALWGFATLAVAQVTTTLLPPEAVAQFRSRLSPSLIPNLDGDLKLDPRQSFTVKGAGFPEFILLPARFRSSSDDAPSPASHCGVFFIMGDASTSFLGTLGFADRQPELCDRLLGVGFIANPSGPPRIILLYNGGSPNYPGKDPVVLDWDIAKKRYASNDKIVDGLKDVTTISAIKAQIRALKR
jgi:hypothetical protein